MTEDILTERANSQSGRPTARAINWTAVTYNACMGSGVLLIAIGAAARFGWPVGAMTLGTLLIGLTLLALQLRRPPR